MSGVLERRLARAKRKIQLLEEMIETRSRELYLANQQLQQANQFMSEVLRSMAGAMVVAAPDRSILMVNARLERMLGYAPDELVGQPIKQILPHAGSYRSSDENTAREEETEMRCKDGQHIPISMTHGPLHAGSQDGHIYMALDIRERKNAEARLRETQHQLVEASRQAGMAEVAVGVIHNVGNVLTAVNTTSQLLSERLAKSKLSSLRKLSALMEANAADLPGFMDSAKGKKIPGFLGKLVGVLEQEQHTAREDLNRLIEHLAHIRAVVAAQQQLAKRSNAVELFSLEEVIASAIALQGVAIERHNINVIQDLSGIGLVETDRHKLSQVLINLISNAVQALQEDPNQPRRLFVRAYQDGEELIVQIEDNGPGIAPENLDRIFQHGFTTKPTGHGFGLHTCANAATELGGRMTVESDGPGHGARFSVYLPATQRQEAA